MPLGLLFSVAVGDSYGAHRVGRNGAGKWEALTLGAAGQ